MGADFLLQSLKFVVVAVSQNNITQRDIDPAPKVSRRHPLHRVYPYLLRDMAMTRPNQMWCDEVTYILMAHGFLYMVSIIDLSSRRVMSWRRSNTLDSDSCVEALQKAICQYGCPSNFNSDQGSQPTSVAEVDELKANSIDISMDGKGD